jgi:hypothetical protein
VFTTAEVAALTGLRHQRILEWVTKGYITPKARIKGPGTGKGRHRWSFQQALGIAVIAGMSEGIYAVGYKAIAQLMSDMEKVTDRQIEIWLGPQDAWTEEEGSVQAATNALCPVEPIPVAVEERMERVCEAIHRKLCGISDREVEIEPMPYRGFDESDVKGTPTD